MNVAPPGQTRLVIVGMTGMVGEYVRRYALDHPALGAVTAIRRRKLGILPQAEEGSSPGLRRLLSARGS
jgi:hypothetical protein